MFWSQSPQKKVVLGLLLWGVIALGRSVASPTRHVFLRKVHLKVCNAGNPGDVAGDLPARREPSVDRVLPALFIRQQLQGASLALPRRSWSRRRRMPANRWKAGCPRC